MPYVTRAQLLAENAALRAEVDALRGTPGTPPTELVRVGLRRLLQWHGADAPDAATQQICAHLATVDGFPVEVTRALGALSAR